MRNLITIILVIPTILTRNLQTILIDQTNLNPVPISQKIQNTTTPSNNTNFSIEIPVDTIKTVPPTIQQPTQPAIVNQKQNKEVLQTQTNNQIKTNIATNKINQANNSINVLQNNSNISNVNKNQIKNQQDQNRQKTTIKDIAIQALAVVKITAQQNLQQANKNSIVISSTVNSQKQSTESTNKIKQNNVITQILTENKTLNNQKIIKVNQENVKQIISEEKNGQNSKSQQNIQTNISIDQVIVTQNQTQTPVNVTQTPVNVTQNQTQTPVNVTQTPVNVTQNQTQTPVNVTQNQTQTPVNVTQTPVNVTQNQTQTPVNVTQNQTQTPVNVTQNQTQTPVNVTQNQTQTPVNVTQNQTQTPVNVTQNQTQTPVNVTQTPVNVTQNQTQTPVNVTQNQTQTPVNLTQTPVNVTQNQTQTPVNVTQNQTQTPVNVTQNQTQTPVNVTQNQTQTPVNVTQTPVNRTQTPVNVTQNQTQTPVNVTQNQTQTPVNVTQNQTQTPVNVTQTPVNRTQTPVNVTQNQTQTPVNVTQNQTQTPVNVTQNRTQTPVNLTQTPVNLTQTPVNLTQNRTQTPSNNSFAPSNISSTTLPQNFSSKSIQSSVNQFPTIPIQTPTTIPSSNPFSSNPFQSNLPVTQKPKSQVVIGLRKFGDAGLSDDLIPRGFQNHPSFKKLMNIDPPKNILPQLLQLRKIIRNIDGSGNNQLNPNWGKANTRQVRRCSSNFADRVGLPVLGLASPRQVSDEIGQIRKNIQKNQQNVTLLFTIWGQFMDHDFQFTPANQNETLHIPIPKCDKFLDNDCNGTRVIPFSRSIVAPGSSPRIPINDITTWIDASNIYGSDIKLANKLRTFKEGKLKTDNLTGRLLPEGAKVQTSVNSLLKNSTSSNISNQTMQAGDGRSNQNLILLSLHTLFMREHNRICDLIIRNTRDLKDEQIYTIAKNYVAGLLQKITYDDFLPILLGKQGYQRFIGPYKGYKDNVNPTMQVQFTTAGYRYGHSLLTPVIPLINLYGDTVQALTTDGALFRPDLMDILNVERIFRGASRTITKKMDGEFVDQVRNLLILAPELRNVRMDLLAINIQRGRDHGLPGFNSLRECYGLRRFNNFNEISAQKANQFRSVYKNINDVDSYIGIQAQKIVPGSILGETGIAVVGNQFKKLREADRFWYQRAYPPQIVEQIKGTKLSHVILRNTAISQLQEDVFHYSFGG